MSFLIHSGFLVPKKSERFILKRHTAPDHLGRISSVSRSEFIKYWIGRERDHADLNSLEQISNIPKKKILTSSIKSAAVDFRYLQRLVHRNLRRPLPDIGKFDATASSKNASKHGGATNPLLIGKRFYHQFLSYDE